MSILDGQLLADTRELFRRDKVWSFMQADEPMVDVSKNSLSLLLTISCKKNLFINHFMHYTKFLFLIRSVFKF